MKTINLGIKEILLGCLIPLLAISLPLAAQEKKTPKNPTQTTTTPEKDKYKDTPALNTDEPSDLYLMAMKQWAITTDYAADSAKIIVSKIKLSLEQDPKLKVILTTDFIADLEQFIYEIFVSKDAITDLAKVYAQYFTLDDMQELMKFYNTPLGKKLIKAEPDLIMKTQQIGLDLLKKNQRGFMELIGKHTGRKIPGPPPVVNLEQSAGQPQTQGQQAPAPAVASQPVATPAPATAEPTAPPPAKPLPVAPEASVPKTAKP